MSQLTVYKASAGSGKTFRLALEYIKLVLAQPTAYRHILAVTFTNKATAEMKGRILGELYKLASDAESGMRSVLLAETELDRADIKQRAQQALSNILHDYSMFSVSTIDKFVQRVIHSLLWELGIHSKSELKLDTDLYVARATDSLIDDSTIDPKLYKHLSDMLAKRLADEASLKIETNIAELGEELFKEQFRLLNEEQRQLVANAELLDEIVEYSKESIDSFEKKVQRMAKEMRDIILSEGLGVGDFKQKSRGVGNFIINKCNDLSIKDIINKEFINSSVEKAANDADEWGNKIGEKLQPKLRELVDYVRGNTPAIFTHLAVQKNISALRLISGIRNKIKDLLAEENSTLLADSGPMLREFVNESDTPFVYEKVGTRYKHIMLDEFQDTSEIQWENFKPLLNNGLAEGNYSLVVGDIKQAIYRWRNSDWRILGEKIGHDFDLDTKKLDTNYRSRQNIVEFNNIIFTNIAQKLENWAGQEAEDNATLAAKMRKLVEPVFDNPTQKYKEGNTGGYVEIRRIEVEKKKNDQQQDDEIENVDYNSYIKEKLPELINSLLQRGYKQGDIAILVRKHKEGQIAAKILIDNNIDVVSADAMQVDASHAVRLCVAAMQYIHDNKNDIARGVIMKEAHMLSHPDGSPHEWHRVFDTKAFDAAHGEFLKAQHSRSLGEIFETVVAHFGIDKLTNELPYVAKLHDEIIKMPRDGAASLERFVKWWNDIGHKTKLSLPDNDQAVNIVTIHKSKGLEYPVVIMPFGNIEIFKRREENKIWTPITNPENYEKYPLYLINLEDIKNSTLSELYIENRVQTMIDALNMLYVALTRPEHELYVMLNVTKKESNKEDEKITHIEQFVWPIVEAMPNKQTPLRDEPYSASISITTHTIGQPLPYTKQAENSAEPWPIESYSVSTQLPPVAAKLSTGAVFGQAVSPKANERGSIMHRIYSQINTHADIAQALAQAHIDGLITADKRNELLPLIQDNLQQQPYAEWFSGKYKVLTERSIITPNGSTYRPDRVMLAPDRAIVVDYKFGIQIDRHKKQVQEYMQLVAQMHQCAVEGYLWYVEHDRLTRLPSIYPESKPQTSIEINRDAIKMLYPGMEHIVDMLLDHNVPFSHDGEVELVDTNGERIAEAAMIIDAPQIAINPFSDADGKLFEQHGYKVISLADFSINKIIKPE